MSDKHLDLWSNVEFQIVMISVFKMGKAQTKSAIVVVFPVPGIPWISK